MIIIKRNFQEWSGEHISIEFSWDSLLITPTITKKKVNNIYPKSGWETFIRKIIDAQIMNLPDVDEIHGFDFAIADGPAYGVEISTKNLYRFYTYQSPELFADRFNEA